MSLDDEVRALRQSAGLWRGTHVAVLCVEGVGALDFLQSASTQSPYVREGRVRQTLFLHEDGSVFADAFIVRVEDRFFVFAEGPEENELALWLESLATRMRGNHVVIRSMGADWVTVGIDGPYAWEVVAGLLGPSVLAMPYLTLLPRAEVLCMRAGKTGEYGYLLLVPRKAAPEVEAKLLRIGAPIDLAKVSRDALDVCALESFHFSMRTLSQSAVRSSLTPIELQLQSRVVHASGADGPPREFVGAAAMASRRAAGPKVRATAFTAEGPVAAGQPLRLEALPVGDVLAACHSPTLGRTVGIALLERRFAHPHLTLSVVTPSGLVSIRTETASLVDNLSLRLQPHLHSYATRGQGAAVS